MKVEFIKGLNQFMYTNFGLTKTKKKWKYNSKNLTSITKIDREGVLGLV